MLRKTIYALSDDRKGTEELIYLKDTLGDRFAAGLLGQVKKLEYSFMLDDNKLALERAKNHKQEFVLVIEQHKKSLDKKDKEVYKAYAQGVNDDYFLFIGYIKGKPNEIMLRFLEIRELLEKVNSLPMLICLDSKGIIE